MDEDEYDEGGWDCERCGGQGIVMICVDDCCRGAGECLWNPPRNGCFGKCFDCNGTGEAP